MSVSRGNSRFRILNSCILLTQLRWLSVCAASLSWMGGDQAGSEIQSFCPMTLRPPVLGCSGAPLKPACWDQHLCMVEPREGTLRCLHLQFAPLSCL